MGESGPWKTNAVRKDEKGGSNGGHHVCVCVYLYLYLSIYLFIYLFMCIYILYICVYIRMYVVKCFICFVIHHVEQSQHVKILFVM